MANQPPSDNDAQNEDAAAASETGATNPQKWDDHVVSYVKPRWEKYKAGFLVCIFLFFFFIAYFWHAMLITIMPGEEGVLWRLWSGTDLNKTYTEGLNIIWPVNKMYIYETRVQEVETQFYALSKNGLRIFMHASVRFRPKREILPLLHKEVGPDYVNRVIIPEVQSAIRRVIGAYNPDDIYGSQGGIINNIVLIAVSEIGERYIQVDDLLIREIRLPDQVAESIEAKLREEQRFLEYQFRLRREEEEAKRKAIEGQGIAAFQAAVSAGINENFLRYKGIDATLKLAQSNNAKVVLIGGKDGLPLILNLPEDELNNLKPPLLPPVAPVEDAALPPVLEK